MAEIAVISQGGRMVVWPPYLVVKNGEEIVFKAVDTDITVFLPGEGLFEPVSAPGATADAKGFVGKTVKPGKIHVRAKYKERPGLLVGTTKLPRMVTYAVYCTEGNDFAEGNTSPVIIIEPPEEKPLSIPL